MELFMLLISSLFKVEFHLTLKKPINIKKANKVHYSTFQVEHKD